jgi:predicted negative regulator of RcsB-dependent stress response
MTPRDRKIRRIAAVQAKLQRMAEWQLMECQAKEHELQDRQRRIIEGFNEENRLPELAAQTASLNLRAASVEQGVIAKAKERLAAHALTEARKLKQVLRIARDVAARAFREPAEGSKG